MARTEVHALPHGGKWAVKQDHAEKASLPFDAKAEALACGRELGQRVGAEMILHTRDGRSQNPNSYGNDPCPPRDRVHSHAPSGVASISEVFYNGVLHSGKCRESALEH